MCKALTNRDGKGIFKLKNVYKTKLEIPFERMSFMARKENKSAYHLIDENIHGYGRHEESGWDTDHRGAGEFYPNSYHTRSVKSVNTLYPTFRRRNITEETSGCITLEASFCILSGDGFYFGLWGDKENLKEAFVLRQKDGFVYAGSSKVFGADNKWHYLKLVLDIDKGECKLHLDGKYVVTLPFTGSAKSLCRLEYGYDADSLGETDVSMDLRMYKNYIFNDVIVPKFDGALPEEYIVEKHAKNRVSRILYSDSMYSVYELKAVRESVTGISRLFDRTGGVVGFEMKYLVPEKGARLTVSLLSSGNNAFCLYDEGTSLSCNEGIIRSHSANVWQTLRIEADTDSKTALVRLNGKIVTTLAFDEEADFIDGVKLEYVSEKPSTFMFTHLKAFPVPPLPEDYVPEPVVPEKKGDYYVGMNICSLWREGSHYGWDCITPFPENKPVLGYYDEGVTETADWELKFMAEHGIDFQLYCWYASDASKPMVSTRLASAIYEGHMLAKYSDKVKIALLWEAQSGRHVKSFADFKKYFVPFFIDYFFSDDRYMTIDGNAIMSVYGITALVSELGSTDEVKKCLDYLRREVKKLGYKDLIIMCCGDNEEVFKKCGMDAVHAYNWGHEGYDVEYTMKRNLTNIASGYVHSVPTVSVGYNLVAWSGKRTPMMTPKDMEKALTWCKDDILPKYDKNSWKSKLVMLSTWNEYGEGTYIMPAGELNGFGYLDAVRSVFRKDVPHVDVIPTEEQLDRIDILHPKDRVLLAPQIKQPEDTAEYPVIRRYEFKTEEDLKKWEFHKLKNLEIKDGRLFGHSDESDPYMILHDDEFFPVSTENVGKIVAHCRTYKPVNAMCCIQHSYMLEEGKWNYYQSACLSVPDRVAPLEVDPRKVRNLSWHGTLHGFRFDPVWGVGDFELESIEFHAAPPHNVLYINGKIVDMAVMPFEEDGVLYIPFDTKSELKKIPTMYYEWDNAKETLTIYGKSTAIFTKGSDICVIDGKEEKLKKLLEFIDGIPVLQADIFTKAIGMKVEVSGMYIRLENE